MLKYCIIVEFKTMCHTVFFIQRSVFCLSSYRRFVAFTQNGPSDLLAIRCVAAYAAYLVSFLLVEIFAVPPADVAEVDKYDSASLKIIVTSRIAD